MSKRNREREIAEAARQASEAGRTLQAQRSFEKPETEPPAESDGARFKPRNDERDQAMDEIVARHERENFAESTPEPPPKQREVEPTPEPTPEPVAEAQPEPVKTVRVKVDGKEFDAPETEVEEFGGVKAYQIHKAAETRLREANEAHAEAKRLHAQIEQTAQRLTAAVPKEPVKTPADIISESMDIIRFGTKEEAAVAFQKVLEASAGKAPDEATLSANIMSRVNQNTGKDVFVKEFSDIVSNPVLLTTAIALENAALANAKKSGENIGDWSDFYRGIGNQVRSAFGRSNQSTNAAVTTGQTSQVTSEKEARKASITTIPTAAARATPAEPDKPESRAETLAKMQAWRAGTTG